jgi:hypothetical protein
VLLILTRRGYLLKEALKNVRYSEACGGFRKKFGEGLIRQLPVEFLR